MTSGPCPITYPFMNETSFCLSVGKQRAIVELGARPDGPGIACAELPWRRDDDPAEVGVYVLGGMNGTATPAISDGNATVGEVCFETLAGIRTYVYVRSGAAALSPEPRPLAPLCPPSPSRP